MLTPALERRASSQQPKQEFSKDYLPLSRAIFAEPDYDFNDDRIVVAGFSQGGAVALQAAVRYPERLAGLVALSTYLLLDDRLEQEAGEANRGLPVFFGHGTQDPMVPCGLSQMAADRLRGMGYAVEWHDYPMQHAVCAEEIQDTRAWLLKILKSDQALASWS